MTNGIFRPKLVMISTVEPELNGVR